MQKICILLLALGLTNFLNAADKTQEYAQPLLDYTRAFCIMDDRSYVQAGYPQKVCALVRQWSGTRQALVYAAVALVSHHDKIGAQEYFVRHESRVMAAEHLQTRPKGLLKCMMQENIQSKL